MSITEYLIALAFLAIGCGVQATLGIGAALVAGPALTVIDPDLLPGTPLALALVVHVRNACAERAPNHRRPWQPAT